MTQSVTKKEKVFIVDDDENLQVLLSRWLEKSGYDVSCFEDGTSILEGLTKSIPSVICIDIHLPDISGLELAQTIHKKMPHTPLIMLTGDNDIQKVVTAVQNGAHDYLIKPVDKEKYLTTIRNAAEKSRLHRKISKLERKSGDNPYAELIGSSSAMEKMFTTLDQVQGTEINILIHGESGTGKELVARAIHKHSSRKSGPFIAINCAAIPENLGESEFFGHEKGAFTGATSMRKGRLEEAHGGTLFLDEIGELSLPFQAKLLRAIQEKTFQRVGGSQTIKSDFRLVCATHKDLEQEVQNQKFREDLYYRLAVFEINVPPLRSRPDDIPILINHFLHDMLAGKDLPTIDPKAISKLQAYPWPGNIRQLQNATHRMYIASNKKTITVNDLPEKVFSSVAESKSANPSSMENIEKQAIIQALQDTGGNLTQTMKVLGMARTTLYRKIKKFGIQHNE